MTNVLKEFLENLSDIDASEIWEEIDSNPELDAEMVKVISDSHPEVG